ncbi:hypothetical protein V8C42DRAFT_311091 [Trichoderma barbatum]
MALFRTNFNLVLHPADVPSNGSSMDSLPPELVELICSWILADRRTISRPIYPPRGNSSTWQYTQCSRTLAALSLASKRYRQIAQPYLYSRFSIGEYDKTQLPLFLSVLCRNPDLRSLVKEIDIQCLPKAFIVKPDTMGPMFDDVASQFSLVPLPSWKPEKCKEGCSEQCQPCIHFKRLLMLLVILTPNLNRWNMVPPNHFYFTELTDVTWKPAKTTAAYPSNLPALASLQHLWVPGAQAYPFATDLSCQEIGLQLRGWLVPSLQTLRLRYASLYHPLPLGVRLDTLKEVVLDFGLLTTKGLLTLCAACKVLESFYFYSRGNSPVFPDGFGNDSLIEGPPNEFLAESIVPAFAHLKGTLRNLAINRWDGARGGADHNVDITPENQSIYATWPGWKGMGMDSLLGSLDDFTALETLKLDSTCLFHYNLDGNVPADVPADHLTKRLPRSLRHLVLPGAPPQMVPALVALASSAASKKFPALKLVELTSDERDVRKREISLRKYGGPRFLRDTYSRFINIEDWNSLEKKFAAAGAQLVHIDSGNTRCFATDVLKKAGVLESGTEQRNDRIFIHRV